MNIADHIARGSREYPDHPAIIFEGQEITYRACDEASSRAGNAFAAAGVGVGDRVALFLPNIPEFAVAYLGVLKLGAIAVSINANLKRDEVGFILRDCGAKAVVTTSELRQHVLPDAVARIFIVGDDFERELRNASALFVPRAMKPDDPALIVYTSGTTGQPKGATLSHANVVCNIDAKRRYLGIRPDDRGLLFLPLYHCFGQNAVFNAMLQSGATVVLHQRFDFERIMESIDRDAVTMFFGVPTTYILLLDKVSPEAMATLRYYFSAAASLPVKIEEQWANKFGAPIFQGYGLTETSPFASYNHLDHYRPGSIGTPIQGVDMKILDPRTSVEAPPGEKGEIVIRGHNVMLGYWNRPEDTASVIRDGWFHTGDIGRVDSDGYFFIEDRVIDMINCGGTNVYPAEVENVLYTHPAIADAAVYGVPHPYMGEQVCADIVLKPEEHVSQAEVRAFCRKRLSNVKVPALLRFVEEIPKGPTGKTLKRVLRERIRARSLGEMMVTTEEAKRWLDAWVVQNLDAPALPGSNESVVFADLGMDSYLAILLADELSDWLGYVVEVTAVWNFPTTQALAEHLAARANVVRSVQENDIADLSDEAAEAALRAELQEVNP